MSVDEAFKELHGFLFSMERDTVNGRYFFKIGIPANWVYSSNKFIDCEVTASSVAGALVKISGKDESIGIDELISFTKLVIKTNMVIQEREDAFNKKMNDKKQEIKDQFNDFKERLEKESKEFYNGLDELKKNSFNNDVKVDTDATPKILEKAVPKKVVRKKIGRPKGSTNAGKK